MAFNKLNIVRDCWWNIASGTNFITDENFQQSTLDHGLYKSLNTNDSQYIQVHGGGTGPLYCGRLESTNIVPDKIVLNIRGAGDGATWGTFGINSQTINIGSFAYLDTLSTNQYIFDLTDTDKTYILQGRVNSNYDYFTLRLLNSGQFVDTKLMNVEVYYSGEQTWDTYTAGLPNILSTYCYPNEVKFRSGSQWINQNGDLIDGSGYYHINMSPSGASSDNTYIQQYNTSNLTQKVINSERPLYTPNMPNGGLSLVFGVDNLEPLTQVTRAILTLRMSLPPSGQFENIRDSFEINGYNARYKEQDYKNEMSDAIGSIKPLSTSQGYFVYGAGPVIEQSGFKNYTVELDFVDPYYTIPEASTLYRNIDIFNTMEFQLVGLPSGTQLSAAQLYLEYLPNNTVGLYTVGGVALVRHWRDSFVDTGGIRSPLFGNGKWQHRGSLNEAEIFDAFYNFSELSGIYTYPISLNAASGAYGKYLNAIYEEAIYDEGQLVDIIYTEVPVEPTRKNIYRNPVRTEFGTTYDPTHYRDMIYNASPFITWDIHDPNATAYSSGIAQVYFDDRIVLGTDFTLYFSLYREPTNQGQNFAQFFHRGHLGSAGSVEYEVQGFLEPEKITVAIKDTNNTTHTASLDIPAYGLEPMLVWITCKYENEATTLSLNVHDGVKGYFYEDWMHDEITFSFPRKQYLDAKTMLGPLYTPSDLDQQLAFTNFFSWTSIVEFGWADSAIDLDYMVTTNEIKSSYDISTDVDKRFLASRLCTGDYLSGGSYYQTSLGGDLLPAATGYISPNQVFSWGGTQSWYDPTNAIFQDGEYTFQTPPWGGLPDAGRPGDWLFGTFDFNLPSGYTAVGLEFRVYGYGYPLNKISTHRVQTGLLNFDNSFVTWGRSQESSGPTYWHTTPQWMTYGGPKNSWGMNSEFFNFVVNHEDFVIGIQVNSRINSWDSSFATAFVDAIQARIYASGEAGTIYVDNFKHLNWSVAPGSGAANCSTTYLLDNWRYDEHSVFNPITTAGTHNLVHPSAMYVEIETEHNTNHPSGVRIICDIEFDTGTTDNWKVFRSEFVVPSSEIDTRTQGFSKHINMDDLPIAHSDVSQINLTLRTSYDDIGPQIYYGDLNIKSIKVYFDSYTASVTGINYIDLYTEGTYTTENNELDLFLSGIERANNIIPPLDLYIAGIPYYASGEMPLYIEGQVTSTSGIPLYIQGVAYNASGQIPLFTKALYKEVMPLYIEGLTPDNESGNIPLYIWATPAGVGGLYKKISLVIGGGSPWHMPLYLHNVGPTGTASSGSMTLMLNTASGINQTTYLYTKGHAVPIETLSLYTTSSNIQASSVRLYTYGSGLPENKAMKLYTHGY